GDGGREKRGQEDRRVEKQGLTGARPPSSPGARALHDAARGRIRLLWVLVLLVVALALLLALLRCRRRTAFRLRLRRTWWLRPSRGRLRRRACRRRRWLRLWTRFRRTLWYGSLLRRLRTRFRRTLWYGSLLRRLRTRFRRPRRRGARFRRTLRQGPLLRRRRGPGLGRPRSLPRRTAFRPAANGGLAARFRRTCYRWSGRRRTLFGRRGRTWT